MNGMWLDVARAGPMVTVQDAGRFGWLRYGVPASGPVDRFSHALANAVCANPAGAAAIEVSTAGVAFAPTAPATFGFAAATVSVDGDAVPGGAGVVTVGEGAMVTVRPAGGCRWGYLAPAGFVQAAGWLGSVATHTSSGLGGGSVATGDRIAVEAVRVRPDLDGVVEPGHPNDEAPIRVVLGPQEWAFVPEASELLSSGGFAATAQADRMGMRLDGPALELDGALTIPSEPIVRGAVQVSGDGIATVLLADHQTTGGYPKIATVVSVDCDVIAQRGPNVPIRFEPISAPDAIAAMRTETERRAEVLERIAHPERTLAQRLSTKNLIDGGRGEPS
ncbi:MAG: biotin-dependent carboxyltransferase family protein [Actinomycetota bacterium]